MIPRRISLKLLLSAVVATTLGCLGTPTTLSPEQLHTEAARTYIGVQPSELLEASQGALATLGYEVTVVKADTGVIKTAPRVAVVEGIALQTGDVTSVTTSQNAIAWILTVTSTDDGSSVLAQPRGFANGVPVPEDTRWDATYMRTLLKSLFDEIESDLPAQGPA